MLRVKSPLEEGSIYNRASVLVCTALVRARWTWQTGNFVYFSTVSCKDVDQL